MRLCEECIAWKLSIILPMDLKLLFTIQNMVITVFLNEHILNSEEQNNWNFHHFGSLKLKSKTLMPVTSTNVTAENHLNLLVCQ